MLSGDGLLWYLFEAQVSLYVRGILLGLGIGPGGCLEEVRGWGIIEGARRDRKREWSERRGLPALFCGES